MRGEVCKGVQSHVGLPYEVHVQDYHRLRVWQHAVDLVVAIYELTATFPSIERYGLVTQIRRSSVSVPSNIAEGCGRRSSREKARFLEIALGSAFELEAQLEISSRLGFDVDVDGCLELTNKVKRELTSLIQRVAPKTIGGSSGFRITSER